MTNIEERLNQMELLIKKPSFHQAKGRAKLDKDMENKLEKSIIKYTVREYLLRNNVEMYGEAQSLIDHFFGGKSKHNLKMEIVRKRITEKDRS